MLHLIKIGVGVRNPAHLRILQAHRTAHDPPLAHLTRNRPRRAAEILDGGSLYWVIGGTLLIRQRITGLDAALRPDGSPCTAILLAPALVPVQGRPVKAFQGWRYLEAADAPQDLAPDSPEAAMPHAMAQQLRELGLL